MTTYSYSRWDGSQDWSDMDEDDFLQALSEDILTHGDVNRALRNLFQRGMSDEQGERVEGLREMMERLRQQRQAQLERYNVDSLMEDLKERLQEVLETERSGIDKRMSEAREQMEAAGDDSEHLKGPMEMLEDRAERSRERLDSLPESPSGAIRELQQYDFMDPEAREKFNELLDMLRQQMMRNFFQSMRQQIQNMTPEQMEELRNMVSALNQMLRDRAMGEDPDFEGFMEQYGHHFDPDRPESLDELIEQLQRQMAAMQSMMESMSPDMRDELESLLMSSMDPELMEDLAELAAEMYDLHPFDDMARDYPFMGEESLTLDQAMELMGHLQDMDDLERQLQQVMRSGNLEDLDPDKVENLIDEEARRQLEQMQDVLRQLQEAGYLKKEGDRLELTPRAVRKLAQQALKEVFSELKKDRAGRHEVYFRGEGGDYTGETKQYEFGDPFDVDLHRTLFNSVLREGPSVPIRLQSGGPGDSSHGAPKPGGDCADAGPEPVYGDVRELHGGEEGGTGAVLADTQPVSEGPVLRGGIFGLRDGAQGGGPSRGELERVGVGDEYPARADAGAAVAFAEEGGDQAGVDDHGRGADGAHGGEQGVLQLSTVVDYDRRDAEGGEAVHAGGDNDQHVHAGAAA